MFPPDNGIGNLKLWMWVMPTNFPAVFPQNPQLRPAIELYVFQINYVSPIQKTKLKVAALSSLILAKQKLILKHIWFTTFSPRRHTSKHFDKDQVNTLLPDDSGG